MVSKYSTVYLYEDKIIEWLDKDACPLCKFKPLKIHKIKGCSKKLCWICGRCGFNSKGITTSVVMDEYYIKETQPNDKNMAET